MFQSILFFANDGLRRAMNNNPPLRLNATGGAVKCLQIALVALGYRLPKSTHNGSIRADGIFGPETQDAVIEFQRTNGLQPDGVVGPLTLTRLDGLLVQTGNDPLLKALHSCRKSGANLIRACQDDKPGDLEHADFQRKLDDLNQLMLGDLVRLGTKVQFLLRSMYH